MSGTTAPPDAAALLQAAVTAHKAGKLDEAIALYRQTLDRAPAMARAHSNLGAALLAKELEGRALAHLKHAVRIAPADPVAQLNLGVGLNALNRHAEAEHVFRSLLAQPRSEGDSDLIGQTCIGLGLALRGQGRFDDSLAIWRRAVALMPKDALAHVNLSMALLTEGRFADGWAEFRWRMRLTDEMHRIGPRQMNRPRWDGRPFAGKTLLVHGEQGYGDNIQFVRLCARAKALGGTVLFACRRELDRLLASCAGIDRVLVPPADDPDQKLDLTDLPHDLQLPLMDLPHALGLRLDDLPGTPALSGAGCGGACALGGARLAGGAEGRAGLGRQRHPCQRPQPLDRLCVVLAHPQSTRRDVLQPAKGARRGGRRQRHCRPRAAARRLHRHRRGTGVPRPADRCGHLGRPSGRGDEPVWTLVPAVADWRWMRNTDRSPWYPSMRLYRQPHPGAWAEVVDRVAADLRALTPPPVR